MEEMRYFKLIVFQVVFFEGVDCSSEGFEGLLLELELIVPISLF